MALSSPLIPSSGAHNRKRERTAELLAHLAAEFINRESSRSSLITVIRAEVNADGKDGRIFVSVLPADKTKTALEFLNRQRQEFRNFVDSHARIGMIPHVSFLLDPEPLKER